MTKILAKNHSYAAGGDITINININGNILEDVDLIAVLKKNGIVNPESFLKDLKSNEKNLKNSELPKIVQAAIIDNGLRMNLNNCNKYQKLSGSIGALKQKFQSVEELPKLIEKAINKHSYKKAHALLGDLLKSDIISNDEKRPFVADFHLTGYLYFSNIGDSEALKQLCQNSIIYYSDILDINIKLLLCEIEQEIATRQQDESLLENNLFNLIQLNNEVEDNMYLNEYYLILLGLSYRRLGERKKPELLLKSREIFESLYLNENKERVIQITNHYSIALIRSFEQTQNKAFLDKAEKILSTIDDPSGDITLDEYQAIPKNRNNLGNVYKQRLLHSDDMDCFLKSHHCYVEAEKYWTEKSAPYEWAMLQKNKAESRYFLSRNTQVSKEFLLSGINEVTNSIKYRTENSSPYQYYISIKILNNLKTAYDLTN